MPGELEPLADDAHFVARYRNTRATPTRAGSPSCCTARTGVRLPPEALFDVQIKRVHEYKRQLLNILETIALYQDDPRKRPDAAWVPRVKIFAGKAAASYERAKLIIKLANDVAKVVNADPIVGDRLKVVFVPNYSVSLAEAIIPAADLSEQISTAGMEASGTGNMKLALNGALTIGTLDGANIEIREHVGADNIFIFGMTAAEVAERVKANFKGADAIAASPRLQRVRRKPRRRRVLAGRAGALCADRAIAADYDRFMVAADFDAYWDAQRAVDRLWQTPGLVAPAILNTARMAWFSSDRTIREYARDIWNVPVA